MGAVPVESLLISKADCLAAFPVDFGGRQIVVACHMRGE